MSSNPENNFSTSGDSIAINEQSGSVDASVKSGFNLSEDIWAVLIGTFLIAAVLSVAMSSPGFQFTVPVYKWKDSHDLLYKVLGYQNLFLMLGIGIICLILSSIAIRLSGGSIKSFARGFA